MKYWCGKREFIVSFPENRNEFQCLTNRKRNIVNMTGVET